MGLPWPGETVDMRRLSRGEITETANRISVRLSLVWPTVSHFRDGFTLDSPGAIEHTNN